MNTQTRRSQDRLALLEGLLGQAAYSYTDLRPAGYILTSNGQLIDAVSEDGYIRKNRPICITRRYGQVGVFVKNSKQ